MENIQKGKHFKKTTNIKDHIQLKEQEFKKVSKVKKQRMEYIKN
jgi:hypothetical protein